MRAILFGAACAIAAAILASACGSSSPAPVVDAGPTLTDAGCYLNPETTQQIINACTDAGFVDKTPTLPLLLSDGGLPALP